MRRHGRAGTQGGPGRVAATTAVAAASPADRPGLPDDKTALSGLAGSVGAALVHRFHGSVLVVRGGDPRVERRERFSPALWAAPSQSTHSADRRAPCRRPL